MSKKILILIGFLTALLSCTKEEAGTKYSTQEELIDKFVSAQMASDSTYRAEYNGGAVRLVVAEGEGEALGASGLASIYYAGYDFSQGQISNGSLFATNLKDIATSAGWDNVRGLTFDPFVISMGSDEYLDGLRKGLEGVKPGEECYILFSGKYGYGKLSVGTINAKAALAYHIWVDKVENN